MKTKLFSIFTALMLSKGISYACNDSCKFNLDKQGFHYWEGLDIGVNGFLSNSTIEAPSGYEFLQLDYARSHSFAWNIGQYNLHLYHNYINLVTGLGLEWNSYAFRKNISLETNADMVTAINENIDFSKNKLRTTWINLPLLIEFNTSRNEDDAFHFAAGITGGYNIFRNKMIQEYDLDGDKQKRKTRDDYNINPFRYELTARAGYGDFSIFAKYAMSEMFRPGHGPKVYPFTAGMTLSF